MLPVKAVALRLSIKYDYLLHFLAPSNTLVSLLYPRACICLYIGSQCPIEERDDSHVGKDPMRSAHMNIQQKFLCIAAYEGFVHNTRQNI